MSVFLQFLYKIQLIFSEQKFLPEGGNLVNKRLSGRWKVGGGRWKENNLFASVFATSPEQLPAPPLALPGQVAVTSRCVGERAIIPDTSPTNTS